MKNRSYANRGRALEDCILYSITHYQHRGEAVICKIHTPFIPIRNTYGKVVNVKVERKSTVDFIGRYKGKPVAFETKNSNKNRISLSEVQPHQAEFLDMWEIYGNAEAFVIVAFNCLQDFYRVPWIFWKQSMEMWDKTKGGKGSVLIYGKEYETNGMASLSPDELPEEWRIDSSNVYRLPFLDGLERIMTE